MSAILFAAVLIVIALIIRWSVVAEKQNDSGALLGLFQYKDRDQDD